MTSDFEFYYGEGKGSKTFRTLDNQCLFVISKDGDVLRYEKHDLIRIMNNNKTLIYSNNNNTHRIKNIDTLISIYGPFVKLDSEKTYYL